MADQQLCRMGQIFNRQRQQHRHEIGGIKPCEPVDHEVGDRANSIKGEEDRKARNGEEQQHAIITAGETERDMRRLRKKLMKARRIMEDQHAQRPDPAQGVQFGQATMVELRAIHAPL